MTTTQGLSTQGARNVNSSQANGGSQTGRRANDRSISAHLTPLARPKWLSEKVWPFVTGGLEVDGSMVAVTEIGQGPIGSEDYVELRTHGSALACAYSPPHSTTPRRRQARRIRSDRNHRWGRAERHNPLRRCESHGELRHPAGGFAVLSSQRRFHRRASAAVDRSP